MLHRGGRDQPKFFEGGRRFRRFDGIHSMMFKFSHFVRAMWQMYSILLEKNLQILRFEIDSGVVF